MLLNLPLCIRGIMASEIDYFEPIHVIDYIVIAVLLLSVVVLGLWSTRRANRSTSSGYFLAGRSMTWWLVGLSLYVSNIGPDNFFGLAGSAAIDGVAVVFYEFTAVSCLLLLGYLFVPVYVASGAFTLPEYTEKRFGGRRLRVYMAVVQLFLNIFVHTTGEMYSGVLIIQLALGWNVYASTIVLITLTAIYTIAGGLTAVMHTDAFQAFIMLSGACILMVLSWIEVGSYSTFQNEYMNAIPNMTLAGNTSCGVPTEDAWHIFRSVDSSMPWPGVLFGIHILGIYFWCVNQVMVQRCLAAKNILHAKAGTILGGYVKLTAMFLMVWPGMMARIFYTDTVACMDSEVCKERCDNSGGCSNYAYPYLILDLMPTGLKGLLLAAMLAGVMSSLTSIFNSASTVFTLDIWKKMRPNASNKEEMLIGRLWTLLMVTIAILWLPYMETYGGGQLFVYLQSVNSHISPPMTACFILAISWGRINEQGAFWGLMVGLVLGVTRMVLSFVYQGPSCGEPDTRPFYLSKIHFLHFAIILFLITLFVIVIVSFLTKPQPKEQLIRMTWWTRHSVPSQGGSLEDKDESIQLEQTRDGGVNSTASAADVNEDNGKCENVDGDDATTVTDVIVENDTDAETHEPRMSLMMSITYWFCGFTKVSKDVAMEEARRENEMMSLKEDAKWSSFVAVNAAIVLAVAAFLSGYFG